MNCQVDPTLEREFLEFLAGKSMPPCPTAIYPGEFTSQEQGWQVGGIPCGDRRGMSMTNGQMHSGGMLGGPLAEMIIAQSITTVEGRGDRPDHENHNPSPRRGEHQVRESHSPDPRRGDQQVREEDCQSSQQSRRIPLRGGKGGRPYPLHTGMGGHLSQC